MEHIGKVEWRLVKSWHNSNRGYDDVVMRRYEMFMDGVQAGGQEAVTMSSDSNDPYWDAEKKKYPGNALVHSVEPIPPRREP